jgi:20S proteasome alpha/beta subunit
MTYIAAFRCAGGFVCCADTQETIEDQKQYVEKLAAFGEGEDPYPFVIGGAGNGEIIEALTQEVSERLLQEKPIGQAQAMSCIRKALHEVYKGDVPHMVLRKSYRSPELLIALNANTLDVDFQLFRTKGRRVFSANTRCIIGYATETNYALLKRFHEPSMPMAEAVVLAAYLVAQSKMVDEGVGGDTSIAFVSQFFAKVEDQEFVQMLEATATDFLPTIDQLFLTFANSGQSKKEFDHALSAFIDLIRLQREFLLSRTAEYIRLRYEKGLLYEIRPYAKIPIGGRFTISTDPETGRVTVELTDDPHPSAPLKSTLGEE